MCRSVRPMPRPAPAVPARRPTLRRRNRRRWRSALRRAASRQRARSRHPTAPADTAASSVAAPDRRPPARLPCRSRRRSPNGHTDRDVPAAATPSSPRAMPGAADAAGRRHPRHRPRTSSPTRRAADAGSPDRCCGDERAAARARSARSPGCGRDTRPATPPPGSPRRPTGRSRCRGGRRCAHSHPPCRPPTSRRAPARV